ncbi:MAG: hypothetical protein ACFFCH_02135 [Promethearchaeota archaeon]
MTRRELPWYPCPTCGVIIQEVSVEEEALLTAPRVPVLINATCEKGHQCVLFVDRNFTIREAEPVVQETKQGKSAVDKAKGWLGQI